MIRMTARVEFEDGRTEDRRVKPWHVIAVEAVLSKSWKAILQDGYQRDEMMLAWQAFTDGAAEFDAWLRTTADVVILVGDAVDPTRPAVTADSSQSSRSKRASRPQS